jgi:RNA polymerase sigma-70 factor, ECF subfamily
LRSSDRRDEFDGRRRTGIVNAFATALPRRAPARRSFAEIADETLDDVHRYLLLVTGDPSLAEDLTSETFEKALKRWKRYDPSRASERTWLCQIARATALDHFRAEARRRRREERYALDEPSAETTLGVGFSPELDSALRSLTAAEREVLALRIVLELDAEAAARVLGIGRSALSMRLARALGKLEERMESHALA